MPYLLLSGGCTVYGLAASSEEEFDSLQPQPSILNTVFCEMPLALVWVVAQRMLVVFIFAYAYGQSIGQAFTV
jgi:hypothetical protein